MARSLFAAMLVLQFSTFSVAQDHRTVTLAEAEAIAIRNHPRIGAARSGAAAASAMIPQLRSAYFPTLSGNITGVGAEKATAVAAGNVTTSSLASRVASGLLINQMITDFGRTASLTRSAELRAEAQNQNVTFTRAQVLLNVRQAYYRALSAQAVLKVAEETVAARRLTLRQVTELAKSNLKSSLDVSFAAVNLSEAELLLYRAENDIEAAFTELSAAMGYEQEQDFHLVDEPLPPPLDPSADALMDLARRERPDLASLRLNHQAALSFAEGERRLRFPMLSAIGTAGALPGHDEKLRGRYGAFGLNMNIPVLNGDLFSARWAEANFKAQASAQEVQDLELRVVRDVKVAWLNASNAFRRLEVTARFLEQAAKTLRLAQARYDLGLSSVVELNQAQLSKTSAEIANASAKYEYQILHAILAYQSGALR